WTHPPQWMWASGTRYTCQIVYLPLWRGFALNTAVFATLLWVSQACFIAVRRSRRRAASRCELCGYPLDRLAKCPECGPVRD
ncbi:MAG: hypothetical protein K2Q09_01550, partial [Phycisphaerales bacterium]|nr:hypothetical protein [Phycisphaerales bacterium]